jgi:CubicO group peptidase (beta-lactamase class C family)
MYSSAHIQEIREAFQELIDDGVVPGLSVAVNYKGNRILELGLGMANLELQIPVHPEVTIFRAASISKPITATALAILVEEGKIGLADELGKWVPEFFFPQITIAQLAGHTAGIRGYRGKEVFLNRPISMLESLELFKNDALLFEPGTDFFYTSFDFVLLSLAMERASGEAFPDLVSDRVLEPLQMYHTFPEVPEVPIPGLAQFYSRSSNGFNATEPVDNRYKLSGGGYITTAGDVCKLGQAYLEGRVTSERVLKPFFTRQKITRGRIPYGLGWQLPPGSSKRIYFGHGGSGVGAFGNFFVFPQQELVVVFLFNCSNPKIQPRLDRILNLIYEGAEFSE